MQIRHPRALEPEEHAGIPGRMLRQDLRLKLTYGGKAHGRVRRVSGLIAFAADKKG